MFKFIIIFCILFFILPSWLKIIVFIIGIIWLIKRRFVFVPNEADFILYFGLPGSGKTTVLNEIARQCQKRKSCTVLSNYPISGTYKVDRSDLGVYDISADGFGTKECVILFDEASIHYFKRQFESFSDKENNFHSMHRHAKVCEVFACQSWDGMDKRLRELNTQLWYVERWYFNLIRLRQIDKDFDIKEDDKQPIEGYAFVRGGDKFLYAPRVWKMFDTFDMHNLPTRQKQWQKWD